MPFVKKKQESMLNPKQVEVVFLHVPQKDTETPDQASSSFKVVATTAGVHLEGRSTPFKTPGDFAELAKTIGLAGQEFVTLQKALRERLAGH